MNAVLISITFASHPLTISVIKSISFQALTFRLARSGIQVSCLYHVSCKVELGVGNNAVGTDCVEFKPVENPKVFVEAGSPATLGAGRKSLLYGLPDSIIMRLYGSGQLRRIAEKCS
jgi:hypothetical protein